MTVHGSADRNLLLTARTGAPTSFWRNTQFDTVRLHLIKVAGRVTEMVTRIKIALPTAYPYQAGFAMFAGQIVAAAVTDGAVAPDRTLRPNLKPRLPSSTPPKSTPRPPRAG